MKVLLWHVHGSWTTAFVQGRHEYLLPVTPERDADGLGRARTWTWPKRAQEIPSEKLRGLDVDVVVLQRPRDLELAKRWLGREPGREIPAVYLEHNTPGRDVPFTRHPLAERADIPVVHVTHFNALMWDCGRAPWHVIEHGIVDPGQRWTGELPHAAVVVNDPARRGRAVGTDLLPALAQAAPLDVFGMGVDKLAGLHGVCVQPELNQPALHAEMARRRVYVHPVRWTSLGLSLIEAMQLGMPVVALAMTEVVRAVPSHAGRVSADIAELCRAIRHFRDDQEAACAAGKAARAAALERYGLRRFLGDWDRLLAEVTR